MCVNAVCLRSDGKEDRGALQKAAHSGFQISHRTSGIITAG